MLPDILTPGLAIVFVGSAKGERSASVGHYYADGRNQFWRLLFAAGLTDRVLSPAEDAEVLSFGIGLTDLVATRSASSDSELGSKDYDPHSFLMKVARMPPEVVAFNGKPAAASVARALRHTPPPEGPCGWRVHGARVYRLPSSSGANTRSFEQKVRAWQAFGRWASAS